MAKRPLASWVDPRSVPLTFSPSWTGWKARPRSRRQSPAPTRDFLLRGSADQVGSDPKLALGRPSGVPRLDQFFGASFHSLMHLGADARV
jgi:hypothetical protein